MRGRSLLIIDAAINFLLGMALVFYTPGFAEFMGVPVVSSNFYPNILGAVFLGITLALLFEIFGKSAVARNGLGLTGAVCINLCGGIMLIIWLLFGRLQLPIRGQVFLWILSVVLVVISGLELLHHLRSNAGGLKNR